MKRLNKFELRKKIKNLNDKYLSAIKLNCFNCMGFCEDGYLNCGIAECPLYPFRLRKGDLRRKEFKLKFKEIRGAYGVKKCKGISF